MQPEAVAARLIAAYHLGIRRQVEPLLGRGDFPLQTGTIPRRHVPFTRLPHRPVVKPSFQAFSPNSNAKYNTAEFLLQSTLRAVFMFKLLKK